MYQMGVLQSLYVTTGASISAVIAATIGNIVKENETEAYKVLIFDWTDLITDQIFVEWPTLDFLLVYECQFLQ